MKLDEKKSILIILLSSFIFFIIKWYYSYSIFGNEEFIFKVLFDTQDKQYLPLIKSLSNLNFSPGYSDFYENLKLLSFPMYGLIFHAILLKIFGYFGIIFYEIIFIFLLIYIVFLICRELLFTNIQSIVFSILFFIIPLLIETPFISKIFYLKHTFEPFFFLRYPRPIVTHLILLVFMYVTLNLNKEFILDSWNKILIFSVFILSFLLNSFFYSFIICAVYLFFIFCYQFWRNKKLISFQNIKKMAYFFLLFIIISAPFMIQLIYGEEDYLTRIGTINLSFHAKKILITEFLKNYFSLKFSIIFTYLSFFLIYLKKRERKFIYNNFKLFYYFFLSSLVAPIIFLSLSPKTVLVTHFSDLIIFLGFFISFMTFLFYLKWLIIFFEKRFKFKDAYYFIFSIFLISFYIFLYPNYFIIQKKTLKNLDERKEIIELTNIIQKNISTNNKDLKIFTNDKIIMNWWILEGFKYLSMPDVFTVSLTDEMIEEQLIHTFKSLGLNEDQFIKFFNENLDQNWRINNRNQGLFLSARKYQANSLVRFSDIKEYNLEHQQRILNSNPKLSQQTIMPNNEILRLKDKFIKFKLNNQNLPDFILIEENQNFDNYKNSLYKYFFNFENDKYCKIYSSKTRILFSKNETCG
jgi:hypothetical protein